MTRRERLERRADRRREWSGKAEVRSSRAYEVASTIAAGIPLGQPILVGHHSERRHRRDQDRIHGGMSKCVAEGKLAEHHASKARGLEIALERSIYDDDPDAIERLEEKIRGLEEVAAKSVAINKAWRKGGRAAVAEGFGEAWAKTAEELCSQFSWLARKGPMETTNDRAEIRRCQKRIALIRQKRERAESAERQGGVMLEDRGTGIGSYVRVTFAEKPDYAVIRELKAAGFHWGSGSWNGTRDKLPESVRELAAQASSEVEVSV